MNSTKPEQTWTEAETQALLADLAAPPVTAASQNPRVVGARLLAGRTAARVKTLTNDLAAARYDVSELEKQIADIWGEGDTTTAQGELKRAEERIHLLELALAAAIEKDKIAQRDLTAAQREVEISIEADTLTTLRNAAEKFDGLLAEVEKFLIDELAPAIEACKRTAGNGHAAYFLTAAQNNVEPFIMRAARHFAPKGRAFATMLGNKVFSSSIPGAGYAAERRTYK